MNACMYVHLQIFKPDQKIKLEFQNQRTFFPLYLSENLKHPSTYSVVVSFPPASRRVLGSGYYYSLSRIGCQGTEVEGYLMGCWGSTFYILTVGGIVVVAAGSLAGRVEG